MSLFRDLTYLEHIKESIDKIQSYTKDLSEEAFQESTLISPYISRPSQGQRPQKLVNPGTTFLSDKQSS